MCFPTLVFLPRVTALSLPCALLVMCGFHVPVSFQCTFIQHWMCARHEPSGARSTKLSNRHPFLSHHPVGTNHSGDSSKVQSRTFLGVGRSGCKGRGESWHLEMGLEEWEEGEEVYYVPVPALSTTCVSVYFILLRAI